MGDPDSAAKAAHAAVEAALKSGVLGRLQAEALEVLAAGANDPELVAAARRTLAGELAEATQALAAEAAAAAGRLEDEAEASDLEELAVVVARLLVDARHLGDRAHDPSRPSPTDALYASARWRGEMDEARRHLKEAADLLDDGEPADTVALEVLAARDRLLAAL
jgi:hypothetical protein